MGKRSHASTPSLPLTTAAMDGDEGRGFDPAILDVATSKVGLGLLSLRERASYVGGRLNIESAPGKGSRFTLSVPLT